MTEQEQARVEGVRKEADKQLSWLYEINEHGKAFLSPRIREQIIDMFLSLEDKDGKPMLGIISDDQSLPDNVCENDDGRDFTLGYKLAQQDMPDFRKVIMMEE